MINVNLIFSLNYSDDDDLNAEYSSNCALDYGKFLNSIEECLEKESDWNILVKVLQELPLTLQYEMNLIKNSQFIQNIFKLVKKKILIFFQFRK